MQNKPVLHHKTSKTIPPEYVPKLQHKKWVFRYYETPISYNDFSNLFSCSKLFYFLEYFCFTTFFIADMTESYFTIFIYD